MAVNPACKLFLPRLSSFVDGELSPKDRVAVENHLAACRDCTARVADFRAQAGLVRLGLDMLADDVDFRDFTAKVMARVTPERPPFWERLRLNLSERLTYQRHLLAGGLVAAGAVAALAIGFALRPGVPAGYAAHEVAVNAVSTDQQAHVAPVVMKQDKDTIIWLVDHEDKLGGAPDSGSAVAAPQSPSKPAPGSEQPKGGEL